MLKCGTTCVLSLAAGALMTGVGMIVPLLPQRVYAVSDSLEGVSLIAAVFALAYLLAQLPVGLMADRFGARPFLVAGYVACGLAGLMFWAAEGADAIYLGRMVQGVGEAPIWALGPALLSLAHPEAKGRAFGLYNAAIHAGLMTGPLLGLMVAPDGADNVPFLVFAALCFAGGGIVLALLPRGSRPAHVPGVVLGDGGRGLLGLLARRRTAAILGGVVLYGACYGAVVSVLPVSLTVSHGFDAAARAILFTVVYAGIGGSQLVAGPLADRFGRDRFMTGGLLLAMLGFAVFPWLPGQWATAPLGAAGFGLGLFCVASLAALNDSVPDGLKGTASGGYYLAWGFGYVLGPLAIGGLSGLAPSLGYLLLAAALGGQAVLLSRVR